jgi:hypothetical protein
VDAQTWWNYLSGPLLFREGTGIPVAIVLISLIILPIIRRNVLTVILAVFAILAWLFCGLVLPGIDC